MDQPEKTKIGPPRRNRRWPKVVAAVVFTLVALILALPYGLSTTPARNWLLAKANATMTPGRVEVSRFSFSWFRPTRIDGFVIFDPRGKPVVSSRTVVWERNLFQILFDRPRFGTFRLNNATVDIDRKADGSIDLVDALRPILTGKPETSFRLVIEGGLRLATPELAEPLASDRFAIVIDRPAAPGEVSWTMTLDHPDKSLAVSGSYARWDGRPKGENNLDLDIQPRQWPLQIRVGGDMVPVVLDGDVKLARDDGRWSSRGKAKSIKARVKGDEVTASGQWSVSRDASGWRIEDLKADLPFGHVEGSGSTSAAASEPIDVRGRIDLPALIRTLPGTIRLREGTTLDRGEAVVQIAAKEGQWVGRVQVGDLSGHAGETLVTLREPATVIARATESNGAFTLDSLAIDSAFLKAEGSGDLDHGVKAAGSFDLGELGRQVGDFVDLGDWAMTGRGDLRAELTREGSTLNGTVAAIMPEATVGPEGDALAMSGVKFTGAVRGDRSASLADWNWDANLAVDSASRAGLNLEHATLSVHEAPSGAIAIDPIEATLNGGKLRVFAEYDAGPSRTLRLLPGTELVDAEVNEEASRRVLSFVAPVLDGATRATGRVSAVIDHAEFPLGEGATRRAEVQGKVVFADLEFAPGPIAADLLRLIGRSDSVLRLDQPVNLAIADGRIHQSGLAIPVGKLARIELDGEVGFDKSLDMRATIPFSGEAFPNNPVLADVASGTRIVVPITGTLSDPKLDKAAFNEGLAQTGKEAAIRAGASLIFRALTKPRDPDAPPPLTPTERKANRLERRRLKRGGT